MSAPPRSGQEPLDGFDDLDSEISDLLGGAFRPVNWLTLTADEAADAWEDLDSWVDWLRHEYGLPAGTIPPCWHLHPELVWELSALQRAWLTNYDPQHNADGPLSWHRLYAEARDRLREWTTTAGCKLDRHRRTRQTSWPGEPRQPDIVDETIADRGASFRAHVRDDIAQRTHIVSDPRG
ncbi:hypothetical protein [Microbacterium sp. No. 7]|uniref:hypothetical protein n=1 Tax=Microbacterium sp. No. 7 TaxID=1714373 RepID=UPI0006D261A5|nr:hypothetical protein [Microbacterium sp. No. 7]ALJ21442.1 hypothetical protein AOA12_16700 [Microbacterium sp. No. 7]